MPNPVTEPELYSIITKYNTHLECSSRCLDSRGRCSKGFPQPYANETTISDHRNRINIKRPRNGRKYRIRNRWYDTTNVVSYNPLLSCLMACHVNVVPVSSASVLAYLFKYIFKVNFIDIFA